MMRASTIVATSMLLLGALGCPASSGGADDKGAATGKSAAAGKDEHGMTSYETQTIGTGVMNPRGSMEGSRGVVLPIRSAEAWSSFDQEMRETMYLYIEEALGGPPQFDPSGEALLFVEFPDGSGSELRPVVDGFERSGTVGRVLGHLAVNPEGEMTDNLTRTWVLVKLSQAALDGDPSLALELAEGVKSE